MSNIYVVNKGDNLTKIAQAHKTTVEELVRLNNISNPDSIFTGQELILNEQAQNEVNFVPDELEPGFTNSDTFISSQNNRADKKESIEKNDLIIAGAAGGAATIAGQKLISKSAEPAKKVKETAVKNKNSVRAFISRKAKRVKTDAKIMYNIAKDGVKNKTSKIAQKARHASKKVELEYAFAKDGVQKKAKRTAKKTKVNTYVGKKKILKYGKKGLKYANRIAPKLIKGASKAAAPVAAVYSVYQVGTAYKKGGEKAAKKATVKVGAGLAVGWAGAKLGAAIGSFGGPIGIAVGGAIGGIAGYIAGEYFGEYVTT